MVRRRRGELEHAAGLEHPPVGVVHQLSTPGTNSLINSDLAFVRNYAIQGNYSGYQVWDISDPKHVTLASAYVCPGLSE